MGRGRAKAKQAKVARRLKYNSPETDFERLQRELSGQIDNDDRYVDKWADVAEDDDFDDPYADKYADDDDLDDKYKKYEDWK